VTSRRRKKTLLAAVLAGGGTAYVASHYRRKTAKTRSWFRAAAEWRTQAFVFVGFCYLWGKTGSLIAAAVLTALLAGGGVSAWYWWRHKKTGISYRDAARQMRQQRFLEQKWSKAILDGTTLVKSGGVVPPLKNIQYDGGDLTAKVYNGSYTIATDDLAKNLRLFADVVGCRQVTMNTIHPGVNVLRFCFSNPLAKVITPHDVPVPKGRRSIPLGVTVSGAPLTIPVLDAEGCCEFVPTFFGGVSRSGKSSTLWATLAALRAMEIPVRLRVVDPKGGAELWALGDAFRRGIGNPLFKIHRYTKDPTEAEAIVKEHHQAMKKRLESMAGKRKHTPTIEEPLDLLIIDEFLVVSNLYQQSGKKAIQTDIVQTMIQGAAAGYSVIACAQLGEKDQLGAVREFFLRRFCFRTETREQTITILGSGGRADSAPAHLIGSEAKGVCYVYDEESTAMVEGRVMYITDAMAEVIAQGAVLPGLARLTEKPEPADEDPPRAVYWHYGYPDPVTGGRPCYYIGSATNPGDRFKQHEKDRRSRRWWKKTDHSARRIEWYPTQAEGYAAEWAAIERDQPLYNDKGNRDNPARLTDEPVDVGA
jgi:DNA segregation ATPase FtsK/SpoIIIE, S-DNA-T family